MKHPFVLFASLVSLALAAFVQSAAAIPIVGCRPPLSQIGWHCYFLDPVAPLVDLKKAPGGFGSTQGKHAAVAYDREKGIVVTLAAAELSSEDKTFLSSQAAKYEQPVNVPLSAELTAQIGAPRSTVLRMGLHPYTSDAKGIHIAFGR